MEEQEARLRELQSDRTFLKEEVDDEDVAEVVARWTGIPVSQADGVARSRSSCTWRSACTSA